MMGETVAGLRRFFRFFYWLRRRSCFRCRHFFWNFLYANKGPFFIGKIRSGKWIEYRRFPPIWIFVRFFFGAENFSAGAKQIILYCPNAWDSILQKTGPRNFILR